MTRGGAEERGDASVTSRGDMGDQAGCHTGSSGVTPTSPKEDTNNPTKKNLEHSPLSPARANSVPQQREREAAFKDQKFKSHVHRLFAKLNWRNEKEVDYIVGEIESYHDVRGVGFYIEADRNGTLGDLIQEVIDDWLTRNPKYDPVDFVDGVRPERWTEREVV